MITVEFRLLGFLSILKADMTESHQPRWFIQKRNPQGSPHLCVTVTTTLQLWILALWL